MPHLFYVISIWFAELHFGDFPIFFYHKATCNCSSSKLDYLWGHVCLTSGVLARIDVYITANSIPAMFSIELFWKTRLIFLGFIKVVSYPVLIWVIYQDRGAVQKNALWVVVFIWVQLSDICRKSTWCNPDKCSCNGDQIEKVTGEVGGSPRKKLTALSVSVNWSTESFLFIGSWQYFSIASTIKHNFYCHYLGKAFKCAHITSEFLQLGPCLSHYLSKANVPSPVSPGQVVEARIELNFIETFRRGCPPFIVWMFLKSEMDAACQVHVWHVSRAYTIVSSSSLRIYCPQLLPLFEHMIETGSLVQTCERMPLGGTFSWVCLSGMRTDNRVWKTVTGVIEF